MTTNVKDTNNAQATENTGDTGAIVRDMFDAFNKRGFDRVYQDATPDFELLDVPTGMTFHGPEGLRQWLESWVEWAPDAQTGNPDIHAAGDWAISEHVGRGTQTGPLHTPSGTIQPTNRAFKLSLIEVYHFRDGQVAKMRAYWDSGTLLRDLGVMP